MKKLFLSLCLSAFLLCGCSAQENDFPDLPQAGIDKTQVLCNGYGAADVDLQYYSIEEMAAKSDIVVYGETVDYTSECMEQGYIVSNQKIKVISCLKGTLNTDDEITVKKSGGYVLIQEYIDSFDEEYRQVVTESQFANLTQEEISTKYISQISQDEVEMEIGRKTIFF